MAARSKLRTAGTIAWERRASGQQPAPGHEPHRDSCPRWDTSPRRDSPTPGQAQGEFRAGTRRGTGGHESRGRFGTAGAEAGRVGTPWRVGTRESRESRQGNSVGGQIGWSSKKKLCHKIKLDP
jgi:hypothetical protein